MMRTALYPKDQNLLKPWFVKFPSPLTGKPQKRYISAKLFPTLESRLKEGSRLLKELSHFQIPALRATKNDIVAAMSEHLENRLIGARPKTVITYNSIVKEFTYWYRRSWDSKDAPLKIGIAYQKHLIAKRVSNTTINNHRNALRTIFGDIIKYKSCPSYLTENPFGLARRLRGHRKSKEWFRPEILQKVLREIEKDPMFWLACQLGMFNPVEF